MSDVLDTCGCCQPSAPPTPETIDNRPGLSGVSYRVGTYASFREAIVERAGRDPALRGWTARTDDDYGMTLIDLWSYVADVLTFYQERIANEAFLRTALLRDSVVKLAGLLGYVPAPGRAAAAQLVFTLERGKALTLPVGLKVQSVPGEGEAPQKFETSADLTADASLNLVQVVGEPVTPSPAPLDFGSSGATLEPATANDLRDRLKPGDTLVAYGPSTGVVEEKRLVSIEQAGPATKVAWDPEILNSGYTTLTKYRRKLHLFGHDAPGTYLQPQFDSTSGEVTVAQGNTPTVLSDPWTLQLDAVYDDIVAGTRLLIPSTDENVAVVTTVILAYPAPALFGPFTGTVTQIEITQAAPSATDPRRLQLYVLDEVDVDLWQFEYPDTITGTRVLIPVSFGVTVDEGRTIVVNDAAGPAHGATVTAAGTTSDGLHIAVDFSPGLPSGRSLDAATATLAGNVVEATSGETVAPPERLGSGDASAPFQRFPLSKFPVTYVRSPGSPHGVASTLEVRVGGLRWHPVDNFYGQGAGDRVYTQTVDDEGKTTIEFGDGVTGARTATGADIVASYRKGLGKAGNVRAGTLTSLLTKPAGLRSVTNPENADGGSDPETLGAARANAPQTVRTFGRIVSLRDFEDAALDNAGVAKARASFTWVNGEQAVKLTVAGDDGAQLTSQSISDLQADLDARRDPFRQLTIVRYIEVSVRVEAVVIATDPDRDPSDVQAAAQQALLDHFAFSARGFGQPVHLSEVFAALQSATGVVGVDINHLGYADSTQAASHGVTGSPAVLEHMRIDADEIATLAASDAVVTTA